MMNLPRPTNRLAGCVWLLRIAAKARWRTAGIAASKGMDQEVAAGFLSSSERSERVREWNRAKRLGRPGYPMSSRLLVALTNTYKHLAGQRIETVFELLDADQSRVVV